MNDFEIISKDAEVNTCYGLETFYITKEEITALLSGKKLYSTVNCGEYAITIEMAESEDKYFKNRLSKLPYSSSQTLKDVREILDILDKHGGKEREE